MLDKMLDKLKQLLNRIGTRENVERLIKEAMLRKQWIIGGSIVILLLYFIKKRYTPPSKMMVPLGEEWVMEKEGEYKQTLCEGDMWYEDSGESLRAIVNIATQRIDIPPQNIFGADSLCFYTNGAVVTFHVTDSKKAVYATEDYVTAMNEMVDAGYFDIISKQKTLAVIRNKRGIKQLLKTRFTKESKKLGITIDDVILHDITVSQEVFKTLAANNLKCLIEEQQAQSQSKIIKTIAKAMKNSGESAAKYVLTNKNLDKFIEKSQDTAHQQLEDNESFTDVEPVFDPQEEEKETDDSSQASFEQANEN